VVPPALVDPPTLVVPPALVVPPEAEPPIEVEEPPFPPLPCGWGSVVLLHATKRMAARGA
jgi:hypothetical protein